MDMGHGCCVQPSYLYKINEVGDDQHRPYCGEWFVGLRDGAKAMDRRYG